MKFDNWNEALNTLAGLTAKKEVIIFFDEISWMANGDKDTENHRNHLHSTCVDFSRRTLPTN